ncbi:MAG: 6-phosphofructokinase [Candidatus Zixiibacteriota bacterium]
MKTLAILTNGGDTCALNASIKSIRDNAYQVGYKKIYGVLRGYQGLLDGSMIDLTNREIDVKIGGSCLGSMRMSPMKKYEIKTDSSTEIRYEVDEESCIKMARTLAEYQIDVLVVIGGDGTLQATRNFQEWIQANKRIRKLREFQLLGFLKTIDNDIRTFTNFEGIEVSLCPGFPSAVQKIVSTIEGLRVTARTAERAFCVEAMGRDAGWLAAAGSFGGAEIILIPEIYKMLKRNYIDKSDKELDEEVWSRIANLIISFYRHNRNVIVSVGEGFEPRERYTGVKDYVDKIKNLFGTRKKVGATEIVTMTLLPVLVTYFKILSGLCQPKRKKIEIKNLVNNLYEGFKTDANGDYKKDVIGDDISWHPLKNWNIGEKMIRDLGLDADKNGVQNNVAMSDPEEWESYNIIKPPFFFEIRPHRTDYVPRSGAPSSYDYRLATVLGIKVGELLLKRQFGVVPCLKDVVAYDKLNINCVREVSITEIRTLYFDSEDYFNVNNLQVTPKITDFFRTIMTGPEDLDEAIADMNRLY